MEALGPKYLGWRGGAERTTGDVGRAGGAGLTQPCWRAGHQLDLHREQQHLPTPEAH